MNATPHTFPPHLKLHSVARLLTAILLTTTLTGCLDEFNSLPTNSSDVGINDVGSTETPDTATQEDTDLQEDTVNAPDTEKDTVDAPDTEEENTCESECSTNQHCDLITGKCITEPILALGSTHTCALLPDQEIKCWGNNNLGQLALGNSREPYYSTPQPVPFAEEEQTPANIFSDFQQTCIVTLQNQVWCWGEVHLNRLQPQRVRSSPFHLEAVSIPGQKPIQLVSGPGHTCVLYNHGVTQCWGATFGGVLGNGQNGTNIDENLNYHSTPQDLSTQLNIQQLATGTDFTCALTADKSVYCWGNSRHIFEENQKNLNDALTPRKMNFLKDESITEVAAGRLHACVVLKDQTIRCWGFNNFGQLGIDESESTPIPSEPKNMPGKVKRLALGATYSCALLTSKQVACTGNNAAGQLGIGDKSISGISEFRIIPNLENVHSIAAGNDHICAVHDDNQISCWGYNSTGQIGNNSLKEQYAPVPITL